MITIIQGPGPVGIIISLDIIYTPVQSLCIQITHKLFLEILFNRINSSNQTDFFRFYLLAHIVLISMDGSAKEVESQFVFLRHLDSSNGDNGRTCPESIAFFQLPEGKILEIGIIGNAIEVDVMRPALGETTELRQKQRIALTTCLTV